MAKPQLEKATITVLDSAKPGQHLGGKEFEEMVMTSPGWQPGPTWTAYRR